MARIPVYPHPRDRLRNRGQRLLSPISFENALQFHACHFRRWGLNEA